VPAQQGTQAVDFAAQLIALPGQGRQVRVRGRPLFVAGSLLGKQLLPRSRSDAGD
jgi:hypothetical protein